MAHALGVPAAAVMLGAGVWAGYLIACRVCAPDSPLARIAAALVFSQCLAVLLFSVLTTTALFRLPVALVAWLVLAGALHRAFDGAGALTSAGADLQRVVGVVRELWSSWPRRFALVATGALVGVRFWIGMAAPPLAFDALLYHAFRPARWVQDARWVIDRAPDQWRYLQFFPHGGEVPWAWAMLATGDDSLIAAAAGGIWLLCAVAGALAARMLGAGRLSAAYAGLAIASIPTVASIGISTYVDNAVLAAFLLGSVALLAATRDGRPEQMLVAAAAFGWFAACKSSGLPLLGATLAFLTWCALRPCVLWGVGAGDRRRRIAWLAAGAVSAIFVAAPGYVAAWVEAGSPLYPLAARLAGRTLHAGNEQLQRLYAGAPGAAGTPEASGRALLTTLLGPAHQPMWQDYAGFGPALLLVFVPAVLGLWRLVTGPGRRATLAIVLLSVAPLVALMADELAGLRVVWGISVARFVVVLPATLILLAAQIESRAMPFVWGTVLAIDCVLARPRGINLPLGEAMVAVLPAAAVAGSGVLAIAVWRRGPRAAKALIGLSCLALAGALLGGARARHRHDLYAALAARPPVFIMHGIAQRYVAAAPLWRTLDDGAPHRIALTAGWNGVGDNVLRYPLLGARLQNHLRYVPITRDGSIIDYERGDDEVRTRADPDAWLARLRAAEIDVVVTLDPPPIEAEWIAARPDLFEKIATGSGNTRHAAFRLAK
jgi:hypothetical protein